MRREEDGIGERGVWFVRRAVRFGNVEARGERDSGSGRRVWERSRVIR